MGNTYYSDRLCPKAHSSPRYIVSHECVECRAEHNRVKRIKHRDVCLRAQLKWKSENLEYLKEYSKDYIKKNSKRRLVNTRNYTARKRNASGSHTLEDIQNLLLVQNYLCNVCLIYLDKYDVDHMIPLSRGGSNSPENLQILCPHCNRSKNDKTMVEWQEYKENKTRNG